MMWDIRMIFGRGVRVPNPHCGSSLLLAALYAGIGDDVAGTAVDAGYRAP